mmetsp:Transcript_131012/g.379053  ORF Transcript_131012/g.379053 Transcript_131012/m.379053 type:complete len:222 (-) Transcript_131012:480-1145(-)
MRLVVLGVQTLKHRIEISASCLAGAGRPEGSATTRGGERSVQLQRRTPLLGEDRQPQGLHCTGPSHRVSAEQRPYPLGARRGDRHLAAERRRARIREDRLFHRVAFQDPRHVWPTAVEDDVGHHAQGPNVDFRAVPASGQHLRRHEWRGAEYAGQLLSLFAADQCREPEVAQLHSETGLTAAPHRQEVVPLDVAMRNAFRMASREARQHVSENWLERRLRQ